jgi:UDP-N-acetylmuramate--alanine ligase
MDKYHHIHFLGIGGMGVSAAAQIAHERGMSISGSDMSESFITENLRQKGIDIIISDEISWPQGTELIVYTNAISKLSTDILKAQEEGIEVLSYPEFAKKLLENKKIIAISGTHGKTTTTSIVSQLLIQAGLDPTAILGSHLKILNGNARNGSGEWAVIEADEYKNAFHNYAADIAVITTLEFDHPDVFDSLEDVEKSFEIFLEKSKQDGHVIGWAGSESIQKVIKKSQKSFELFDIKNKEAFARAENILYTKTGIEFEIQYGKEKIICKTNLPGKHNILNVLAAFLVSQRLNIPVNVFQETIQNIQLPWRRFEVKSEKNAHVVIDDYAHHPTEITATINAAKNAYPNKKIIAIFEPHHEGRTQELFDDFTKAFQKADDIILTNIYKVPGRRVQNTVDIQKMADQADALYIENKNDIPEKIQELLSEPSVILIMGAGSINSITDDIIHIL